MTDIVHYADYPLVKDIFLWLRAPDPSINYSDALLKRQKNTGRWFIDGHQFAKWRDSPNSSLWIYGIRKSTSLNVARDAGF